MIKVRMRIRAGLLTILENIIVDIEARVPYWNGEKT